MLDIDIEIKRQSIHIKGVEPKDIQTLIRSLSAWNNLDKVYTHRGFVYNKCETTLKIPSSVGLQFILDKLSSDNIVPTNIIDNTKVFSTPRLVEGVICKAELRDSFQIEAVNFLDAFGVPDEFLRYRLVNLDVGFGKTVCAIKSACNTRRVTLITSINLSKQWIERITSFTNLSLGKGIYHITDHDVFTKILDSEPSKSDMFYIIGLDAIVALLRKDPNSLQLLCDKLGVGGLVFDEAHAHFIKIINILVNINVERVQLLTATAIRSQKSEDSLYGKLFRNNVPVIGERTKNKRKFNIIYFDHATQPGYGDMVRIQLRRGIHAIRYFNSYIMKRPYLQKLFFKYIMYFSEKMFNVAGRDPSIKIMVYIQSCALIKQYTDIINNKGIYFGNHRITAGDYTNNTPASKREGELEKNIIFTTLGKNMGLDIPNLKMVQNLIPLSSELILKQIIGRLRDEEGGYYVDYCDNGFPRMSKQLDTRIGVFKSMIRNTFKYTAKDGKIVKY